MRCWKNSDQKSQNWTEHRKNSIPSPPIVCRNHLTYRWNRVLVISLLGSELGSETYIDDLLVSSALLSPPNFTLIGKDDVYTILVWKSWCSFEFSRISRRDGVEKKQQRFLLGTRYILFFSHVLCCVRVSTYFRFFCDNWWKRRRYIRTAFGNIVRFLAGPACITQQWWCEWVDGLLGGCVG